MPNQSASLSHTFFICEILQIKKQVDLSHSIFVLSLNGCVAMVAGIPSRTSMFLDLARDQKKKKVFLEQPLVTWLDTQANCQDAKILAERHRLMHPGRAIIGTYSPFLPDAVV